MNDKQQLAAMGEHLAEQRQSMCMAKRIEELEAQVLVMAGLLLEAKGFVVHVFDSDINYWSDNPLLLNIDAALAGNLSDHTEQPLAMVPEGWQPVPVEVTLPMQHAYFDVIDKNMQRVETDCRFGRYDSAKEAYLAMLSAAPKPEADNPGHSLAMARVRKTGGSCQHTGTVVSEFRTLAGEPRIVMEFDAPVAGMLHIYRPDQVETLGMNTAVPKQAGKGEE